MENRADPNTKQIKNSNNETPKSRREPQQQPTPSPSQAIENDPTTIDDAVKVFIRVRPLNDRESEQKSSDHGVLHIRGNSLALADPNRPDPYTVTVDQVFSESSNQADVYDATGAAAVEHCMAGFNSSIFAYGMTGSGKTHTMLGDIGRAPDGTLLPSCGIIPRVFEALFASIAQKEQAKGRHGACLRYSVKCSFLEIYNEEITDLLAPSNTGLQIRDGDLKKGLYVQGLSETEVLNADDVLNVIAFGSENRRMAATRMNDRSSRSHSVFTAIIEAHERSPTGVNNIRYAKLNLIDLAGSERVNRSGVTGGNLTEAKSINRSLTVLGRVISALVDRQKRSTVHVPYRDSRLTFLLQESLGGNAKTAIIATVTPAADSVGETYSTLNFAAGAKKIRCRAVVNEECEADTKALTMENARLQQLLNEASLRPTIEEAEAMKDQLEQARALFDQNCTALTALQAEQVMLRKELIDYKSTASRLTEETAALRADNAALGHALEAAEGEAERALREIANLQEEVQTAKAAAAKIQTEVAELQSNRVAMEAMLEEARTEVRRVQTEAKEESLKAAAREEGLRLEAEAARSQVKELESQVHILKKQLGSETMSVAKYRRMVGEIDRLIDWAQNTAGSPSILAKKMNKASTASASHSGQQFIETSSVDDGENQENTPSNTNSRLAGPSPAALAALRAAKLSLATQQQQQVNVSSDNNNNSAALEDRTNNNNNNSTIAVVAQS